MRRDLPEELVPIVMPTAGGKKRVGYEGIGSAVMVDGQEYIILAKDIPALGQLWPKLGLEFEPLRTRPCALLEDDYYRQITGRVRKVTP